MEPLPALVPGYHKETHTAGCQGLTHYIIVYFTYMQDLDIRSKEEYHHCTKKPLSTM